MKTKRNLANFVALVMVSVIMGAISVQAAAEIRLRTDLAGAAINGITPKGRAEFRERTNRQLNVQVEGVNLPDGTLLNVLINGNPVGQITLATLRGSLQLNTNDNQMVPAITQGASVVVTDSGGATIVAGVF